MQKCFILLSQISHGLRRLIVQHRQWSKRVAESIRCGCVLRSGPECPKGPRLCIVGMADIPLKSVLTFLLEASCWGGHAIHSPFLLLCSCISR